MIPTQGGYKKHRSGYFWLMVCLYALLALGLCLWIVGILTGQPAAPGPPELMI